MGFYDEALVITRSLDEIANLLSPFAHDPATFELWKNADDTRRMAAMISFRQPHLAG